MQFPMSGYLRERVLEPIGIEALSWDVHGGSGSLGPLTNAHTGVHISARELARFGYLALRCYIMPSLDLVVARVGTGPATWDEPGPIGSVVAAISAA